MAEDDDNASHVNIRTSVNPADFMTERMVTDRCQRMYRLAQWKRLHEFCVREPRARDWTLRRIAQAHSLPHGSEKVVDLFNRLTVNKSPKTRVDLQILQLPDDVEVDDDDVEEAQFEITEVTDPRAHQPTRSKRAADAALTQFVVERDEARFVDAARSLLAYARLVPPSGAAAQFPIMAVEFREVAAELAREGEFRLLIELCVELPARVTAGAVIDMGEKLKLGAQLHEAALKYQMAQREKAGSQKNRDGAFMEAARRVLAEE